MSIGIGCPHCTSPRTKVIDSRGHDGFNFRRRECLRCKRRFSTHEIHLDDLKRLRAAITVTPKLRELLEQALAELRVPVPTPTSRRDEPTPAGPGATRVVEAHPPFHPARPLSPTMRYRR